MESKLKFSSLEELQVPRRVFMQKITCISSELRLSSPVFLLKLQCWDFSHYNVRSYGRKCTFSVLKPEVYIFSNKTGSVHFQYLNRKCTFSVLKPEVYIFSTKTVIVHFQYNYRKCTFSVLNPSTRPLIGLAVIVGEIQYRLCLK